MSEFNELIPVNAENPERITVSAKDLHSALEVNTPFKDWCPRMWDYGFDEGTDCSPICARTDARSAGAVWDENPQRKWLVWLVFGALIASICFGLVEVIKWAIGA